MTNLIYEELTYQVIGLCMEVHNELGPGFSEIVYKDALEYELQKNGLYYEREKQFKVQYKDIILPHDFYADFAIANMLIFEAKAVVELKADHTEQTLNYLAVSGYKVGLLANFRTPRLQYKRFVR